MADVIRPAVRAIWLRFTEPLEGAISHFYRCTSEEVTIALGVMFKTPESALWLPLLRADGTPATSEEIVTEWQLIKITPGLGQAGYRAAAPLCKLHLTPQGIELATWRRLDEMAAKLAERFPDWPSYPADAQLAILSLAWACGTSFDYPKCAAAIRARDWTTAAAECRIRVPDLQVRSAEQKLHFLWAARVEREGLDPAELHPGDPEARDPTPAPEPEGPVPGASEVQASAVATTMAAIDEAHREALKGRE